MTQHKDNELYSSDQPINSKEEERFNRWPFAFPILSVKRLQIVQDSTTPQLKRQGEK
jgi:hypothetical protein